MSGKSFPGRVLSVLLTVVLSAGIVFVGAPAGANAATTYKLVKKVICYSKVDRNWEKTGVIEFTYNKKGDIAKIYRSNDSYSNGKETTYTYVYTYKNGKKAKAKVYKKAGNNSNVLDASQKYDKNGRLKSEFYEIEYYGFSYDYGKNGYITEIHAEDFDSEKFYYRWNGRFPESIMTKETGYWGMCRLADFNKKGLIKETDCNKNLPDGSNSFKYSYVNGRVKSIQIAQMKNGNPYYYKYVVKYTDKKTDAGRYRDMINYITCRAPGYTGKYEF